MRRSGTPAICVAAIVSLSASCGKKGENWDYALSPGIYDLTGPLCVSTDAAPAYKDVARRINLFDFANTTQHTLTVEAYSTRRVITDSDCKLTVEQPIETNRDGSFAHKIAKKFTFEPGECTLTVASGTKTFEAGRSSSEAFKDTEDNAMDVPFEIRAAETTPGTWLMITSDNETLNNIWGDYGCSVPDRIKWTLTRRSEA